LRGLAIAWSGFGVVLIGIALGPAARVGGDFLVAELVLAVGVTLTIAGACTGWNSGGARGTGDATPARGAGGTAVPGGVRPPDAPPRWLSELPLRAIMLAPLLLSVVLTVLVVLAARGVGNQ